MKKNRVLVVRNLRLVYDRNTYNSMPPSRAKGGKKVSSSKTNRAEPAQGTIAESKDRLASQSK